MTHEPRQARGHRLRNILILLLLFGGAVALTVAVRPGDAPPETKVAPPIIQVARPLSRPVPRYLHATGWADALARVTVTARVKGALRSVEYRDGASVQAGQPLFRIEDDLYRAQVAQAEASVAEANAALVQAQRDYDRQRRLVETSAAARATAEDAQTRRDAARAQLDAAKATLDTARIDLGYTTVTAPFSGVVTAHRQDVGALVGVEGATELAEIMVLDPVHVTFAIPETEMLRIRAALRGQQMPDLAAITVQAGTQIDADFPLTGRLDYAAPATSTDSGTLELRAVFDNPDRALVPGMFLRLRIPLDRQPALMVPVAAVGTDQQGRYVLAVGPENRLERRAVTLLEKTGDLQPVTGALAETDLVAANVLAGVAAGQQIAPQER
ncbi:efflux RND transporter periplasmic adaptor subunit [Paracoccus laeviglucosivorans]|uniref:RND family efflux transporter, MFP subunit n=1 Tax=Paracoccus laeviglucosivorans TaxID=1197861 RepID=A0A521FCN2_9RHOB|nr:efflux RND transporter periplasmic adaptor subunit [Paracoccus laeviglucosivorans]SMO93919.1 RND family efflux transporter, MFP subunit [Paracoccus laeviglucosivorans]